MQSINETTMSDNAVLTAVQAAQLQRNVFLAFMKSYVDFASKTLLTSKAEAAAFRQILSQAVDNGVVTSVDSQQLVDYQTHHSGTTNNFGETSTFFRWKEHYTNRILLDNITGAAESLGVLPSDISVYQAKQKECDALLAAIHAKYLSTIDEYTKEIITNYRSLFCYDFVEYVRAALGI